MTVTPDVGVVVGVPGLTVAVVSPGPAVSDLSAGQVIVGAGVPNTLMVNEQLPEFNSDETFTVFMPTGKNEPEAGFAVTAPQLPLMISVGVKVTNAPGFPP